MLCAVYVLIIASGYESVNGQFVCVEIIKMEKVSK